MKKEIDIWKLWDKIYRDIQVNLSLYSDSKDDYYLGYASGMMDVFEVVKEWKDKKERDKR